MQQLSNSLRRSAVSCNLMRCIGSGPGSGPGSGSGSSSGSGSGFGPSSSSGSSSVYGSGSHEIIVTIRIIAKERRLPDMIDEYFQTPGHHKNLTMRFSGENARHVYELLEQLSK